MATAQTDMAVQAVMDVSPDQVVDQLSLILATGRVSAIKTGMLHSAETVIAIAHALSDFPAVPLVIDPGGWYHLSAHVC